jgi:SET domain-containing protein
MGLFIGEDAKKGDFLGEYLGEILSPAEVERRGALYDKRGTSYIFTLNKVQAIDATRMGNKLRFINHQHKKFNCRPKILMVNGAHRIGFWMTRDMVAGEELFFDYG